MQIQTALAKIVESKNLSREESAQVFNLIMTGETTDAQIGAFLAAMRVKGETAEELAGAAETMRSLSSKVPLTSTEKLVDTCGTGGSGLKLFNISTAAAFVASASGALVAKHGNRKMTSFCGSADVLEAAGIKLELTPEQIADCINQIGIGFMFAPAHHSAMRYAGPVRQELSIRTMMNILGPMTNPAQAKRQVIGVFAREWQEKIARVLQMLGSVHALVVHSEGLDEIRLDAPTHVVELKDDTITEYTISPRDFGIAEATPEELQKLSADSVSKSLELVKESLSQPDSLAANIVALNAGAAIYASGVTDDLKSGVSAAQIIIAEKSGLAKLEELALLSSKET